MTVTDVQPGDTLTAVDGALQSTSQASFQLPAAPPPDTTTQYEVLAGNCYQELPSVDASAGLDGTMKVTVFYATANVEGVVTPSL